MHVVWLFWRNQNPKIQPHDRLFRSTREYKLTNQKFMCTHKDKKKKRKRRLTYKTLLYFYWMNEWMFLTTWRSKRDSVLSFSPSHNPTKRFALIRVVNVKSHHYYKNNSYVFGIKINWAYDPFTKSNSNPKSGSVRHACAYVFSTIHHSVLTTF